MVYPSPSLWQRHCKRGMAQLDLSLFYQTNPGSGISLESAGVCSMILGPGLGILDPHFKKGNHR